MKIYVSHSLTDALIEYLESKNNFKKNLEDLGFEVLHFFGLGSSPSAFEVYQYDIKNVENSDLVIMFTDRPSFGGGQEFQHAIGISKNILVLKNKDLKVTRMILGPVQEYNNIELFEYDPALNYGDILEYLKNKYLLK